MKSPAVLSLGLVLGGILGFLLAAMALRGPGGDAPEAPPRGPSTRESLEEELLRWRSEAAALRARLARLEPAGAAGGETREETRKAPRVRSPSRGAAQAGEPRGRAALALLDEDREIQLLLERHSREEASFTQWTPDQFLQDPAVNPEGVSLDGEGRQAFELLLARAQQRIRILELRRQLAVAEAVGERLEEAHPAEGRAQGGHGAARSGGATTSGTPHAAEGEEPLAVSLALAGLQITLRREEHPEIYLLDEEKRAAMVEWLLEARRFLAGEE